MVHPAGRIPAGHRGAGERVNLLKLVKAEHSSHSKVDGVEVIVDSMEAILAHVPGQDVQSPRQVGPVA